MGTLEDTVADLVVRVARLEARDTGPESVVRDDDENSERGHVRYSGEGPWQGRTVVWRMERTWDDIVATDSAAIARSLSSLASPVRIQILTALIDAPASTGELTARIDVGTSGQLFHHLKELLAAGLVSQPQRGVYALRPQHVLPALAVLSAAMDLPSGGGMPEP